MAQALLDVTECSPPTVRGMVDSGDALYLLAPGLVTGWPPVLGGRGWNAGRIVMTAPQAPLPKRRPMRTREELVQAGRQGAEGMRPTPEPAARLAALLMLAFPVKPSGTRPRGTSTGKDGRAPG